MKRFIRWFLIVTLIYCCFVGFGLERKVYPSARDLASKTHPAAVTVVDGLHDCSELVYEIKEGTVAPVLGEGFDTLMDTISGLTHKILTRMALAADESTVYHKAVNRRAMLASIDACK